jgi:Flp pilus assembly protein TadG
MNARKMEARSAVAVDLRQEAGSVLQQVGSVLKSGSVLRGRVCRRSSRRRGAAVVEMAIVTPLLIMMLLGVMEFGWVMMVRETLTNATREACRVRVLQGSTDADALARFSTAVAPSGLRDTTGLLTIAFDTATSTYTVTATVPRERVSLTGVGGYLQRIMPGFLNGNIRVSCSMRQESSLS